MAPDPPVISASLPSSENSSSIILSTPASWFHEHLQGKSAVSLACATAAARGAMRREVRSRLSEVERLYLDKLMATRDANEGLVAFLAKRKPQWEHR